MRNYVIRAINKNKTIRFFIGQTTDMVQEIRNIHESSATGSAAMGRLATIASMMGLASLQDDQSLTISFDGKGPGGKLVAVANADGFVKVTATNPQADPESKYPGKLDVGSFVGRDGNLSVVKDLKMKEPYVGLSEIVTGEIAEDMANYFFYSEQTPTAIALGVLVDKDLSIRAAGGKFIQVLPDASEEDLIKLEDAIKGLKPVSELIDGGLSPEEILSRYFSEFETEIIATNEVGLYCDCSRERIETGLESIGKIELENILKEDGKAEVVCDFCKKTYIFNEDDLKNMINNAK